MHDRCSASEENLRKSMAGNVKKLLYWGDIIGPSGQHSVSIFSLVIKPQKSPGGLPNSPWENLARTHCRHALLCNWTDYASKKIVKEILKEEIYNINLWGIIITMYQSVYKIFFPDCEHTVPYHRSCFLSTFF